MGQGIKRGIATVPQAETRRLDSDGPAAAAMQKGFLWYDLAIKHLSIIVGVIVAYAFQDRLLDNFALSIVAGFLSVLTLASANYVLVEWLDRIDAQTQAKQAGVSLVSLALFSVFAVTGLLLASQLGNSFWWTAVAFLFSGMMSQIRPFRRKDVLYLNVIVRSINNPIQLTLGWVMIDPSTLPPIALVLAYWTAAALLAMLSKSRHSFGKAGNIQRKRFVR
ncbi:hypothetical protein [Sinorhizobium fredii]|uniref:hypothetical protein n=1 Tax=Rhizobium fredii TaxID=380 RepID=UPI0035159C03